MPLKLNVGIWRKMGLPDYGWIGASCSLELELDGLLLTSDLEAFHAQVRHAYGTVSQAVQDDWRGSSSEHAAEQSPTARPATKQDHRAGTATPGAMAWQSSPVGQRRRRPGPPSPTANQVNAIRSVAQQKGVDLVAILRSS